MLAGCFTTYGQALKNGGPIAISIMWPLISVMILMVAFSMAELASSMPTAGGIYYWASKLGGPGWGWFTGWFNLIGLVAVVASVDYVCATFLMNLLGLYNVHFVFNFAKASAFTDVHYSAHVNFALFACLLFGHRANLSGFGHHMYWFYVLPLGFLLTMYTITGYDASTHVSEETHGSTARSRATTCGGAWARTAPPRGRCCSCASAR